MTLLPNYVDESWKELLSDDFIEKLKVLLQEEVLK